MNSIAFPTTQNILHPAWRRVLFTAVMGLGFCSTLWSQSNNVGVSVSSGDRALSGNTGSQNCAFGQGAMNENNAGTGNSAIGYRAIRFNSSGEKNSCMGYFAMTGNTSGSYNAALGATSMNENTSGSYNTAIGYQALKYQTTGSHSVAIGANALKSLTSGSENIALGSSAMQDCISGSYNIAIGRYAGTGTAGDGNVFLGYNAGQNVGSIANKLYVHNNPTGSSSRPLLYGDFQTHQLAVNTTYFGDSEYTLAVNGSIGTNSIEVVSTSTWPDYVFSPDYELRPLQEVELFIQTHCHLPGVRSAAEMDSTSLNLADMDLLLLEKIEELTLYLIDLQKENASLAREIKRLQMNQRLLPAHKQ